MENTAQEPQGQDEDVLKKSLDAVVSTNALTEVVDAFDGYFILHQAVNEAVEDEQERGLAEDALFLLLEAIRDRLKAVDGRCRDTGVALLELVGK
jgi:hypothetical protein